MGKPVVGAWDPTQHLSGGVEHPSKEVSAPAEISILWLVGNGHQQAEYAAAYAASLTATRRPAERLEICPAQPVVHTALRSLISAETQVAAG